MAYAERRDSSKGPRYRGFYKDSDGRYKSAGTYDSEERALEVSQAAEKYAAELISGSVGGLDPVVRATRTVEEYAPIFLRHHRVEGNTKDGYADTLRLHVIPFLAKVRVAEMNKAAARGYFTALEEAGRSPNIIRQAKVALGAMFTMAVADGYLGDNPFHDVRTPKVRGPRAIKIVTSGQVADAVLRACAAPPAGRVNIGSGTETSIAEVQAMVSDAAGQTIPPAHGDARPGDIQRMCLRTDRAAARLGWSPRTSLADGIAALIPARLAP